MSSTVRRATNRVVPALVFLLAFAIGAPSAHAAGKPRFGAPKLFVGLAKGSLTRAGDVNGDGRVDLVSGGTDLIGTQIVSVVIVQLNTGHGFGPLSELVVRDEHPANGLTSIRLADLNHDGALDVAGGFEDVFPAPSNLFTMLGNGDGTFGPPALLSNGDPLLRTVLAIDVGDATGDGNADIVSDFGNTSPNQVSVLPGTGTGAFGPPIISGDTSVDWKPSFVIGDFTGDGVADVVAANSPLDPNVGATDLMLEQGTGGGHFTLAQTLFVDANVGDTLTAADLNGDGRVDLVVDGAGGTDAGRGGLYVALAAGSGLSAPTRYGVPVSGLAVADFNLDGHPDLATGNAISPYLWVSVNAGDGTFARVASYAGSGPEPVAADFTGDGKPDILAENFSQTKFAALMVNLTV